MKLLKLGICLSVCMIGYAGTAAASSSLGVTGTTGQLLSQVSTAAGSGNFGGQNGAAKSASFRAPSGIAIHPDGSVWIADSMNHLIRKLSDGRLSTEAGWMGLQDSKGLPSGTLLEGTKSEAVFQDPQGIAIDSQGNVYVADTGNHAIRKITTDGQIVTLAGDGVQGNQDGKGMKARFNSPSDIAIASDGTLYVADTLNHLIRQIATDGTVTTLNHPSDRIIELVPGYVERTGDYRDGELSAAQFNEPSSIVIDKSGNLYVSDTGNHLIRYIDLKEKMVRTAAGNATLKYSADGLYKDGDFRDGEASDASFNFPKGIALTSEGGLVIADSLNHAIRYLYDGQVTTLAGEAEKFGWADGVESAAQFHIPVDVAVDAEDQIWIADSQNQLIRKLAFYRYPDQLSNQGTVQVLIDQIPVSFSAPLQSVNGWTMAPVRTLAESLGAKVSYETANGREQVLISKDDLRLEWTVGENVLVGYRDSTQLFRKSLQAVPFTEKSTVYAPIRTIAEELGFAVQWSAEYQAIILREK